MSYHNNPNNAPQAGSNSGAKVATGCGVGCLVAALIAVLVVAGGIIWGVSFVKNLPKKYTSAEPIEIEVVDATPAEKQAIQRRFDMFRLALATGLPAQPLELTTDDVNLLIATHPDFSEAAGKAKVLFIDDTIQADLSVPIENMGELVDGRYFNGRATFKFEYKSGSASFSVDSVEMNGSQIPKIFVDSFVADINAEDPFNDPQFDGMKRVIDEIKVEDGVLKIVPTKASERGPLNPASKGGGGPAEAEAPQ